MGLVGLVHFDKTKGTLEEFLDVLFADEDLEGRKPRRRWARDLRIRSLAGVIMGLLRYSATARRITALHRNYFVAAP